MIERDLSGINLHVNLIRSYVSVLNVRVKFDRLTDSDSLVLSAVNHQHLNTWPLLRDLPLPACEIPAQRQVRCDKASKALDSRTVILLVVLPNHAMRVEYAGKLPD